MSKSKLFLQRAAIALAVSFVVGCQAMLKVDNPESPEWPCGPKGIVCSGRFPRATCCWEGDVCGYDGAWSTCPAGSCCWEDIRRFSEKVHEPHEERRSYKQWISSAPPPPPSRHDRT